MSEPNNPAEPVGPMRFDTAEFGSDSAPAAALNCAACQMPILGDYFEVNGKHFCPACKDGVVAYFTSSRAAAFFRALVFGLGAGIAGSALYFVVLALTGYEVGLIAIAVGLMVGMAVRKGSRYRGGWLYQGMAMIITYGSIVTSFVPLAVKEFLKTNPDAGNNPAVMAVFIVVAWVIMWPAPFLGLPENFIGCLIIGFGVYEAWKLNQCKPLAVSGPFSVASCIVAAPPATHPPSPPADS